MLIVIGALLVSAIFPFVIYFFLRNAHQDSAVCQKDCRKLFLSGLLLGFPVFGLSFLCSILFSLTHISHLRKRCSARSSCRLSLRN